MIDGIPWVSPLKKPSSRVYIDNIHISNTYPDDFRFPYEKTTFYKGYDRIVATVCDVHNVVKPEVFTLALVRPQRDVTLPPGNA